MPPLQRATPLKKKNSRAAGGRGGAYHTAIPNLPARQTVPAFATVTYCWMLALVTFYLENKKERKLELLIPDNIERERR